MNECTDGFEDSHTHTNECVDFSWSIHTHKYLRTCLVLFCFFYFWSLLSSSCVVPGPGVSKIVDVAACSRARSCIHWEGCSTYVTSCACLIATSHDTVTNPSITGSLLSLHLGRVGNSTFPQAVFGICRRLHLRSQPSQDFQRCMTCQHRHSRNLRNFDPFIFHRLRLGFADHCSPFSRPSILASRLFPIQSIHGSSDDGIRRRARDCL
jgi:hypothetical protein